MSARQPIVAASFFLLLAIFSVATRDVAGAQERWPPWQSYTEAEEAARQKALRRKAGPANNQAVLKRQVMQLQSAGKYAQALPLAQRLLSMAEKKGPDSIEVADALDTLAGLYEAQSKFADAEPLLKRSLAIREKAQGQPGVTATRDRLATTYDKLGKADDAKAVRDVAAAPAAPSILDEKSGGGGPGGELKPAPSVTIGKSVEANGRAMQEQAEEKFSIPSADAPKGGEAPPAQAEAPPPPAKVAPEPEPKAVEAAPEPQLETERQAEKSEPALEPKAAEAAPEPDLQPGAGADEPFSIPPADAPAGGAAPPPPAAASPLQNEAPAGGAAPPAAEDKAAEPLKPKFAAPRGMLQRRGSPYVIEVPEGAGNAQGAPPPAPSPGIVAEPEIPDGRAAAAPPPPPPAASPDWQLVPVYWGTDRAVQPNAQRLAFGSDRARKLQLGMAQITVPKTHEVPNVERPWVVKIPYFDVTLYAQTEDPKQHFTVKEIKALTKEELLAQVKERLKTSTLFKDQALVFVHGYNTSFDNALYRTAQIAYDLDFDGAPFLYSWPSGGAVASYTYDRESAQASEPYLKQFLEMVVKETGAKQVSIIAHSMGNQPVMDVLRDMRNAAPEGVEISQVILAAPDVDADTFTNLASTIKGLAKNVTLYVAANDRALIVSRNFWGSYRAGDVPPAGPLVLPGIDTVDVTAASTDVFAINHSGYASNSVLLTDIGELMRTGLRPPEMRILKPGKVTASSGDYWRYVPAPQ